MDKKNEYQLNLYKDLTDFSKKSYWNYPIYCNYNDYFEDYFYINYAKFVKTNKNLNLIYIPVTWTSTLKFYKWEYLLDNLQTKLDNLSSNYFYFTVCTHDNAPMFRLPQFTKNFSAGHCCDSSSMKWEPGKKFFTTDGRENIPIPLITNSDIFDNIDFSNNQKKYLASFIGSDSDIIRLSIKNKYKDNYKFYINLKNNENMKHEAALAREIDETRSMKDVSMFINKSLESYFTLCPRGWGATSYRLYEAMKLHTVPVYISDIFWLPYQNEINWNDICVFIKPDQIDSLEYILEEEIKSGRYNKKLNYIKEIYNKYFTFKQMFNRILETINNT